MPAVVPKRKSTSDSNRPPSTIGKSVQIREKDTHEQLVSIWDPEGNKHRLQRHQANDFVRHFGWTSVPPKGVSPEEPETEEASETEGAEAESTFTAPEKEPDELDLLRAEFKEKAGIDADQRWGKKRLQEELGKFAQ